MEPTLDEDDWVGLPDLGTEHPSLLSPEQPYLRIERTFIFVDLSGFTSYTRREGADRAAQQLTAFRHATRTIASRRGVRVAKWLGDGAMLVGVEAGPAIALGAHLITRISNSTMSVRVGIATGTALLFEGDDYIGEPVNLAARLCNVAGPGEVLAACSPADVPDWVSIVERPTIALRGLGHTTVLRLAPGPKL